MWRKSAKDILLKMCQIEWIQISLLWTFTDFIYTGIDLADLAVRSQLEDSRNLAVLALLADLADFCETDMKFSESRLKLSSI